MKKLLVAVVCLSLCSSVFALSAQNVSAMNGQMLAKKKASDPEEPVLANTPVDQASLIRSSWTAKSSSANCKPTKKRKRST